MSKLFKVTLIETSEYTVVGTNDVDEMFAQHMVEEMIEKGDQTARRDYKSTLTAVTLVSQESFRQVYGYVPEPDPHRIVKVETVKKAWWRRFIAWLNGVNRTWGPK